ncbi:hypothetical protein [uncultured Desulfuromonas sp.]|uniref:hypothetical protein n=1 Tax=uncultured Desulfuromonas sp. TaxID=181013 RepID=UPI002631A33E|nr:hypothetical protein [uncultured Desulfuromonas sp.]
MRRARLKYLLLGVLLLAAFVLASGYLCRERLIDRALRPLLERAAAAGISAEVGIGGVGLDDGAIVLRGFRAARKDTYTVVIPRATVGLTLAGLLQGRLGSVHLDSPRVTIEHKGGGAPGGFPLRLSLPLERLTVEGGELEVLALGRQFLLREIAAELAGGERYGVRLAAALGEGGIPLRLRGEGRWEDGLSLVINELRLDGKDLILSPANLDITPKGEAVLAGSLGAERLDGEEMGRLAAAMGVNFPLPDGWHLRVTSPRAGFRVDSGRLHLQLEAAGAEVGTAGWSIPLERPVLELDGPAGLLSGRGRFAMPGGASGTLRGRIVDGAVKGAASLKISDPAEWARRVGVETGVAPAGGVGVEADFEIREGGLALDADWQGADAGRKPPGTGLDLARFGGQLSLRSQAGGLSLSGDVWLDKRRILTFSGDGARLDFQLQPLSLPEIRSLAPGDLLPEVLLGAEAVSASGQISPGSRGRIEASITGAAKRLDFSRGAIVDLLFSGRLLRLSGGVELRDGRAAGRLDGGGVFSGALRAAGSGRIKGSGVALEVESLVVEGVEYLSADGLAGIAGGEVRASGRAAGRPGKVLTVDAAAYLDAAEALWGPYYADLSGLKGELAFHGEYRPVSRRLQVDSLTLTAADLGTLSLRGVLLPGELRAEAALEVPRLDGAFSRYFKGLLSEPYPAVEGVRLGGGVRIDADLARGRRGWSLGGELRPADLDLYHEQSGVSIRGLAGRIPFDLRREGFEDHDVVRRTGAISFAGLSVGPASLEPAAVRLVSGPNRMEVGTPLLFELAGGSFEVDRVAAAWTEEGPDLEAGVRIAGVDLGRLTRQFGTVRLSGRLAADLGRIRYAGGVLTFPGVAHIDAFGGRVLIRNIRWEEPLSPYATAFADLDFSGLDLHQVTRSFAFGEMNGIVDGHVHGLRLFRLVPSRFSALLKSRPRGKRNISVKALNNLSLLSQGSLSAALSRGLYRFIDFYRYREIGLRCTLEKDWFRLEGSALPGSDRHLVYGGLLPPRINIIAPAHPISFKEMLKRLGRIDRTGSGAKLGGD